MLNDDTIYALATVSGKSAIATFRISGKNTRKILENITSIKKIETKKVKLTRIYANKNKKDMVDTGSVIFYKSPKSYTGEDLIELSVHGSPVIIKEIYKALFNTGLCRLAYRGEFTRRAFENNKIDLIQAEAVADLINAETKEQRIQATNQLLGKLGLKISNISKKIKTLLANQETMIDFSEEEIPENLNAINKEQTMNIIREIKTMLEDNKIGENIRDGFSISILGKTNTGKSSLINYLAKRDLAIVSKIPGTTTDIIELKYDLNGLPLTFYDTAGLRKTSSSIEKIGINKAIERSSKSSINLIIITKKQEIDEYNENFKNIIFIKSKSDIRKKRINGTNIVNISSKNGRGIPKLLEKIHKIINLNPHSRENIFVSRERHRQILTMTMKSMIKSMKVDQIDLKAEEIRNSLNFLSKITGNNDIDEILDIIFNDFCIGK